jgi:hypothetical protein
MNEQCPSNFVLDAFRLGFHPAPGDHVKSCPRCTDWLAAQAQLQSNLAPLAIPAERQRPRAGIVKVLFALGLPAAVGATVLLFFAKPKPSVETAKGAFIPVQIARMRAGTAAWLPPQGELLPNDSVRFFVGRNDRADRYVLVGSVDGSGQLSRFYPAEADGCSLPLPAPGEALPGSIVIDAIAGPERVVVVVSHHPLCWPTVAEPVRRLALDEPVAGELAAPDVHATRLLLPKQVEAGR